MVDEKDECIRRRAYELWESEERPRGEDIRHWMQAENEFQFNEFQAPGPANVPAAKDLPAGADEDQPDSLNEGIESPAIQDTPELEITIGTQPAGASVRKAEGP